MSSRNTSGLTAAFVRRISKPGKYYDLYGLCLRVAPSGRRYWEQRLTFPKARYQRGDLYIPRVDVMEGWVRIPEQSDHRFRRKVITHSGGNRSPIPAQTDQ